VGGAGWFALPPVPLRNTATFAAPTRTTIDVSPQRQLLEAARACDLAGVLGLLQDPGVNPNVCGLAKQLAATPEGQWANGVPVEVGSKRCAWYRT
jgi:hypothetical protein